MASLTAFGLDVGIYGATAEPETILRLARHAEEAGFDSVWLADHVVFPVSYASRYPYSAGGAFPAQLSEPLMEPIATMGVLVGATRRVRIGTAVLVMPYRNPLLLARMLVTLDRFSGGRIVLGAGVGWLEEEFKVLDSFDFKKRGRVTDDYIEIFKAIAAGGEVGYQGETYAFEPVYSSPGSVQRPHPPILIGGIADAALRRVVRHGDGWLAVFAPPSALPERLDVLRRLAEEAGRPFRDLSLVYKLFLQIGEAKRGPAGARETGTGSAAEIADDVRRLFDLGFQKIIVRCRGASAADVMDQVARFSDTVLPAV